MSNNETKATCPAEDDQPNISGCIFILLLFLLFLLNGQWFGCGRFLQSNFRVLIVPSQNLNTVLGITWL